MNFYYELLAHNLVPVDKQNEIKLLDPAVASTFTYLPDDYEELHDMFGGLNLDQASLVIFPINDNTNPNVPSGGTHWSLMVMQNKNLFYYIDSANSVGYMPQGMTATAKKLLTLCNPDKDLAGAVVRDLRSIVDNLPRQENHYDCGMYALLFTRMIIENVLNGQKIKDIDYSHLTPEKITMARKEI